MSGFVQTVYGPVPGCPECGVISLRGPLLCSHGVTPASDTVTITTTVPINNRDFYDRLVGGECESDS